MTIVIRASNKKYNICTYRSKIIPQIYSMYCKNIKYILEEQLIISKYSLTPNVARKYRAHS